MRPSPNRLLAVLGFLLAVQLAVPAARIPAAWLVAPVRADGGGDGHGSGGSGGGGTGGDHGGGGDNSGKGSGDGSGNSGPGDEDHGADSSDDGSSGDSGAGDVHGPAIKDQRVGNDHERAVRSEIVVAAAGENLSAFARARGFRIIGTTILGSLGLDVTRLQAPADVSPVEARDLVAAAFPGAVVDFNHLYQPQTSLSLPAGNYAAQAVRWNSMLQHCGGGQRVGLIDTAVDWSLPILKGARRRAIGFLESGSRPAAPQHGTGIATLLVGQRNFGLLPDAEIYSAAIFGVDEAGRPIASATSFAAALNWLLENQVATINISLSGPPDRLMELAVRRARSRGAQLVAAVGNDGLAGTPRFPAAYPGVIGVTAVDHDGRVLGIANRGDFVALAAPGVDVWIPGQPNSGAPGQPTDLLVTGTSFAAPYVTAVLAVYGNDPQRMIGAAADLGAPGPDPIFGHGMVQAPVACLSAAAVR